MRVAGNAAADDDNVIHGVVLQVVDVGDWALGSARKLPITVLTGRMMPYSISADGSGKLDLEARIRFSFKHTHL
ncbi:hypothetical protein KP22_13270 [Pectobacterium betavasculorum]|uniref:Uncharacterized protein n=1 Tax=Pectobacterium betavasculorum TaxID=55207 RepID=A0A093S404_9GAMM|nr:hypothetical protein KP22_13270 [Pectobacterium betavasculorum]